MSEVDISPLARKLAEENNVNWQKLPGSGPDGRVVERDVLEYLAKVMAGEEAMDPTPEPVPEGMEAWPEEDVRAFEVMRNGAGDNLDLESFQAGVAKADHDASDMLENEAAVSEANSFDAFAAPSEAPGEDDLLATDVPEDSLVVEVAGPAASTAQVEQEEEAPETLIREDMLLFAEDEDDFEEFTEDEFAAVGFSESVESVQPEFDEPVIQNDLTAMTSPEEDTVDLADEPAFEEPEWAEPVLNMDHAEESGVIAVEEDIDFAPAVATEPEAAEPAEALDSAVDLTEEETPNEMAALLVESEFEEAPEIFTEPVAATEDFLDDAEQVMEDIFEVDQVAELQAEEAPFDIPVVEASKPSFASPVAAADEPALVESDGEEVVAAAAVYEQDELADEDEDMVSLPASGKIPLVSHGLLLRRHVDLSALTEAQLAVGRELGEGAPIAPTAFLLRAAAKALHRTALGDKTAVAVALIDEQGVKTKRVRNADESKFTDLLSELIDVNGSVTEAVEDLAVVVADMSNYEVDEAVLHLDAPVLMLGRILYDSKEGSYRSTLSLSGDVPADLGSSFLATVAELLDSPVQLVI